MTGVARDLAAEGIRVPAVCLGQAALASAVRQILDAAGFLGMRVLVSGGLDKHAHRS